MVMPAGPDGRAILSNAISCGTVSLFAQNFLYLSDFRLDFPGYFFRLAFGFHLVLSAWLPQCWLLAHNSVYPRML
jgi:hypothetical protein